MSAKQIGNRTLLLAFGALLLVLTALALNTGSARAESPITHFEATPSTTQAGGHPDVVVDFRAETRITQQSDEGLPIPPCGCNDPKEITVQLPAGIIGNPHAAPRCSLTDFINAICPVDSQVGLVVLRFGAAKGGFSENWVLPLYNMIPTPTQAGLLAFSTPLLDVRPVYIAITARTEGDYGLETKTFGIPRAAPAGVTVINWGVPADPMHDALRFPFEPFSAFGGGFNKQIGCREHDPRPALFEGRFPEACERHVDWEEDEFLTPSNSPPIPFISGPTTCGDLLTASIESLAYDGETDSATAPYPTTTGCSLLSFDPSQSVQPTTTEADSPSGLDFTLDVPQFQSPTTPSPSSIRSTVVQFPPGLSVNANAADGKSSCTDQQAGFGTRNPARCPEQSKIGTLSIESSALPGLLHGFAYLGEPLPGNRYRTFLIAEGFGLNVKLDGTAHPDTQNGMRVVFEDLPQAPFQQFKLHIFGGERGVFATPERCGAYPIRSTFTPWASELGEQDSTQFFMIDKGPDGRPCPGNSRPFSPGFQAVVTDNSAGVHSPFIVNLTRTDGEQYLSSVNVSPPAGFSGILKGIPYCPEAAIAQASNPLYSGIAELSSPACGAASQIGTATGGAGAGSQPLYQGGKVYLAGPYKGAPLSLLVVIPAVSGPYDLGNVATRVAIHVDPVTARVNTVSDPLPQTIDGIPLRVRQVRVNVDRPRFALNPTNCDPLSTDAQLFGAEGAAVNRSSHFQIANCANLGFEPKLFLRLRGGTKRADHPALRAVLMPREGDANIAFAAVALPRSEFLENAHIRTICTRAQFASRTCPDGAIYGRAVAHTPILDQPLRGPVYLRSSSNLLPDLVMDLRGQVDFNAIGRIDTVNGGIRNTFDFIPDIPVSKVVLRMQGGNKGLLVNSRDVCKGSTPKAVATYRGQNGARYRTKVPLRASCAKAKKRKRARHSRNARVLRARSVR